MMFKNSLFVLAIFVLIGCGGTSEDESTTTGTTTNNTTDTTTNNTTGTTTNNTTGTTTNNTTGTTTNNTTGTTTNNTTETPVLEVPSGAGVVALSGTITYDFIPFKNGGTSGLDYNNISQEKVRGALLEIIDSSGSVVGRTSTNADGAYSINVAEGNVKVRVSAKLYRAVSSGQSSWDFEVKDNTNNDALYVMEGSFADLGTNSTQVRDLHASSGWDGRSYSSTRTAGPFAILDVVYQAIEKVTIAQSDAIFKPLDIFWSKNNVAASGDTNLGQIITSHFNGTSLFILGSANSDTDEYDTAVVAHEWGHYYESAFSRSDSIGGSHGSGDMLDIRVAFGEGFGTALGCMIIDSPLYLDSLGNAQGQSFGANLESKTPSSENPGWFSEASVYRVLYDIFDSNDDTGDTLSLGFTPIHNVLRGAEKNAAAFTSIFTFIKGLKDETGENTKIDAITSNESIAPINDIYGTGRTNRANQNANPLYADLTVGGSVNIVTNYSATATSARNKLGTYNFVKFTIPASGNYTFNISQVGGSGTPDPDFAIYQGSSTQPVATAEQVGVSESLTTRLSSGTYRMAVIVYDQTSGNTFKITLN